MKDALPYLTDQDATLLCGAGEILSFKHGEAIRPPRAETDALLILHSGVARVQSGRLRNAIFVDHATPGHALAMGPLAYAQELIDTVMADGEVEVLALPRETLDSLFMANPACGMRFYRSLAAQLNSRLGGAVEALPPAILETGTRSASITSTQRLGEEAVTPALAGAVELFRTVMLSVERGLISSQIDEPEAQRQIRHACDELVKSLDAEVVGEPRQRLARGAYAFRETFHIFMKSRFLERVISKPRGYAGDYATIEMVYDNVAGGEGRIGPFIDRWFLERPASQAVRLRRGYLTDVIRNVSAVWTGPEPMPVTSLGSGPAREALDLFAGDAPHRVHVTCIDIDPQALSHVADEATRLGASRRFTLICDNLIRLSRGIGHTPLPPQRLIYSIGLIDYFEDALVVQLLDWIHERLLPGGLVVVGNFAATNPDRVVMDHIAEWPLIHRSPDGLRELFRHSRFGGQTVEIDAPAAGVQLFARCAKP